MKENMDKLDQLFEKAFTGFEESPPEAIKNVVFKRILLFNTWRLIRKYFVVFMILLMIGSITYFSGAFSTGKSQEYASQTKPFESQMNNLSGKERINSENSFIPTNDKITDKAELLPKNIEKKSFSNSQKPDLNNSKNTVNTKPVQYDKTNTLQIKTSLTSQNLTGNKEKVSDIGDNSGIDIKETTDLKISKAIPQNNISTIPSLNNIDGFISNQVNDILLTPTDNSNKVKDKKTPLLWSIGFNLGHSLMQSNLIKTSEQVSDDNFIINTSTHFPSGHIGVNIRGERKHLYFDFGLQYASYSEKISTNMLLYNAQEYQNVDFLGQNTIIDTNGGYWHYFYLSTTTISIVDSIWTWRTDTNLISLYDTNYMQRYDTLKDPSWINTYSQFEFPVNIGWMKNFGRVNLGVSTGPILSLLVGTKGKMPYHITNNAEMVATRQEFQAFKFGISWQISGFVNYQFNDRMMIEFSPYYKHTLLPYKSSASSATLKINSLGLQIGLRYYF
jgi:hypothetical protein